MPALENSFINSQITGQSSRLTLQYRNRLLLTVTRKSIHRNQPFGFKMINTGQMHTIYRSTDIPSGDLNVTQTSTEICKNLINCHFCRRNKNIQYSKYVNRGAIHSSNDG